MLRKFSPSHLHWQVCEEDPITISSSFHWQLKRSGQIMMVPSKLSIFWEIFAMIDHWQMAGHPSLRLRIRVGLDSDDRDIFNFVISSPARLGLGRESRAAFSGY